MYKAAGSAAHVSNDDYLSKHICSEELSSPTLQIWKPISRIQMHLRISKGKRYRDPHTKVNTPPQLKTSPFIGTDVNLATPEDLNQLPANGVCKRASSISYYDMPWSCQSRQISAGNHMAHPEHLSHPIPPYHLIRFFFSFSCLSLVVVTALHTISEPQSLDTISNCSSTLLCDINITLLWQSNQRSVAPTRRQLLTGYDKGSQKGRSLSGRY